MKKIFALVFLMMFGLSMALSTVATAQCAMCTAAAESGVKNKTRKTGLGINTGVLLLLAMPYTAFMVVGFLWYKNSSTERKKKVIVENKEVNGD